MANAFYPKWKETVIQGGANSSLAGTVKAVLVDTGTYTYSAAHQFLSSLTGVVGTAQTLGSKTYTSGAFDAADTVFTALSGASAEAIVVYIDTGVAATSQLVAYLDTGYTGLPVTPGGGDVTVVWPAGGIFAV